MSEERLGTFIRRSLDGIVIIDSRGTILEWNEGQEEITGIPRSEAVGRPVWELQHRLAPEEHKSAEFLRAARERALNGLAEGVDLKRAIEEEIQRPDGTRRTLQSVLLGFRVGEALLAGGICRDITERIRLEEDLRERQALLLEAARLAHLGHWARDVRSGRSSWSDEIYRILGHAPGAFVPGREAFLAAVAPEDRERIGEALSATARDGVTRRAEYRVHTPDGSVRYLDAVVELLRDAGGAPARIIGTVQDITDRKTMEQALADANRHKDEFLAILSHELRSPLAPLRNALYVLARSEPGGEQARHMQAIIERQVSHLTRLVDDLLDVTRISRGKVQLQRERVDLAEIVRRTVEDHRSTFAANGIAVDGPTASNPMWLNGDPTRIAQVVGNILTNAAKFTPRGGRVDVALEQEGEDAVVRVRDTGVGITRDMLDRLFEPFTQADQSLDRAHGGLGLGLSVARDLAELHGGSVTAASEGSGRGAEFVVRLPLEPAAERIVAAEAAPSARPRRVLIIEDDTDAAVSLQGVLELDGHQVQVARNGPDGLAKARAFQPEVVLCDIGLPGMDGYEVARACRSDEALSGMFLVALSGYALPDDRERAQQAGFQRHLAKPPSFDELQQLLAQAPARHPPGATSSG